MFWRKKKKVFNVSYSHPYGFGSIELTFNDGVFNRVDAQKYIAGECGYVDVVILFYKEIK